MSGASLRKNAFLLVLLTAAVAVLSDWSRDQSLAGLWRIPAVLLLLGLAYESWVVARSGLAFDLEMPEQLFLGRSSWIRIVCRHALRRTLALEVAPSAPDDIEIENQITPLLVPAGESAALTRRASASRLGDHSWPSLKTRVAGPLGLAWWPKELICRKRIRVVPDLFRSGDEVKGLAASGSQLGLDIGAGAEVLRLREYRDGDPPRVIDWKATARSQTVMVREFTREDERKLKVVFDNPAEGEVREEDYESAVRLAASLAWHFADGATDISFAGPGYSGPQEALSFLKYLAVVQPLAGSNPTSLRMEELTSGAAYNLVITSRQRGSIPTQLWNNSYFIYIGSRPEPAA